MSPSEVQRGTSREVELLGRQGSPAAANADYSSNHFLDCGQLEFAAKCSTFVHRPNLLSEKSGLRRSTFNLLSATANRQSSGSLTRSFIDHTDRSA